MGDDNSATPSSGCKAVGDSYIAQFGQRTPKKRRSEECTNVNDDGTTLSGPCPILGSCSSSMDWLVPGALLGHKVRLGRSEPLTFP